MQNQFLLIDSEKQKYSYVYITFFFVEEKKPNPSFPTARIHTTFLSETLLNMFVCPVPRESCGWEEGWGVFFVGWGGGGV